MENKKKVSLVLSSGGARGVAHIGVIEALEENGFEISSIAGSSMGAVVGGVYAAGKLPEYKEWICNLDKLDVLKLMDFTFSTQGFVQGDKVFNEMKRFMGHVDIEDLSIPFAAVATDLKAKREVVFKEGDLYTALRASAAIPSVVKPSIHNGRLLVDGGVLNPIPVRHVTRSENDMLIISDVNANVPCIMEDTRKQEQRPFIPWLEKWNGLMGKKENKYEKRRSPSLFDLLAESIDLMQDRISDFIVEESRPDLLIKVSRDTCSTFEFHRSPYLIRCGYHQTRQAIHEYHTAD